MANIALQSAQSLLLKVRYKGEHLAYGTGFVVETRIGPVLLTARHVVTGRDNDTNRILSPTGEVPDEILILHNKLDHLGAWFERSEPLLSPSGPRWREHLGLGPRADFVALPLTALNDVHLYPYRLGVADPPIKTGPSDTISVIGFPFGLQAGGSLAVWATGFVASEPEIDFEGLPIFLIDCRSRSGQSGSAVITFKNGGTVSLEGGNTALFTGPVFRFLGLYSGRINPESDLGIVWKERALIELCETL